MESSEKMNFMLAFLSDLALNNHRDWMHANDKRYKTARNYFIEFCEGILTQMQAHDPQLTGLEAKQCVFRQSRDIRFSKDKTPYKTHFSMAISRQGKNSGFAAYYFQIAKVDGFMGGGIYMPPNDVLKKIREEIDYSQKEYEAIITAPDFVKNYKELDKEQLKTMPKGYEKDHPMAEALRLKSFTATQPIHEAMLMQPNLAEHIVKQFKILTPFLHFLNRAVTPHED